MESKFLKLYNLVMEELENTSLNTKRHGLQKIDQMNTKKFLDFLREILPLFKDNQLDLNKVTITEKPDGSAIRLIMNDGKLLFESSYSGVVEWDKMPFPEQSQWMKKNLENKLANISKTVGYNFKVIGELIWCDQLIENDKVTPVGASYLAKYFGKFGGIIIIDLLKIENDQLVELSIEEFKQLTHLLKETNDDNFVFYSKQEDMQFNQSITLSLNIDQLIQMLQLPEYNKLRYTTKDQKIIDEVEQIKTEFLDQLENIIMSTTGHFSEKGDLIEGLVLTVLDSGNEYGVFSRGYKDMKSKYNFYESTAEKLYREVLTNIFGTSVITVIRNKYDETKLNEYTEKFNQFWFEFVNTMSDLLKNLKIDKNIPLATKSAQITILSRKVLNYSNIKTFNDLLIYLKVIQNV